MIKYDSVQYAASRLNETVIRHNGVPVMVRHCDYNPNSSIRLFVHDLQSDKESWVNLSDCDLTPVPLGYVNYGGRAHYLMRAPMRKDWRQGLRFLNIVNVDGSNLSLIPMKVIANTIIGKYPSYEDSLKKLSVYKKLKKIAFDRNFSISHTHQILYKDLFLVGSVNIENGNINIHDEYDWVKESLYESLERAA